jgi:hypothetical protein
MHVKNANAISACASNQMVYRYPLAVAEGLKSALTEARG